MEDFIVTKLVLRKVQRELSLSLRALINNSELIYKGQIRNILVLGSFLSTQLRMSTNTLGITPGHNALAISWATVSNIKKMIHK